VIARDLVIGKAEILPLINTDETDQETGIHRGDAEAAEDRAQNGQ
jgi:hypothetical protein